MFTKWVIRLLIVFGFMFVVMTPVEAALQCQGSGAASEIASNCVYDPKLTKYVCLSETTYFTSSCNWSVGVGSSCRRLGMGSQVDMGCDITGTLSCVVKMGAIPVYTTLGCSTCNDALCNGVPTYTQNCGSTTRNYSCTSQCGGTITWDSLGWDCKECQTSWNCGYNTRDCTASVCRECGPFISAWTPACGDQTRTCTENCGTDGCAGVVLSQCAECGPYYGVWSACNINHQRSRSVSYDCSGDDTETQNCVGTVTGTLFDASDVNGCSAGEIAASPKFGSQAFGLSPTPDPLKWPVISLPVVTNAGGVYSESVYASAVLPAVYQYDYTNLVSSGLVAGVKFECQSVLATVTTQAQVVTKDTGFWKLYGGWWQIVGGSVYARSGLLSDIPSSNPPLVSPFANQKLILPDANSRTGVLSHGFAWAGTELGTNPNAGVSEDLWRIESLYEGLRYDYNFYKTRMDIFDSTVWAGGSISYNDGGVGYQIFEVSGTLSLNAITLSVGQKAIVLVDGSVNVNGDLIVPEGAFLGMIARNGITFGTSVNTAQGWFVAENISVSCNQTAGVCNKTDSQFDGQGSFVGWTGITLDRDMGLANNTSPSEKFTYRADFFNNVPAPMKWYPREFSPFIP